jgi:hypothetical protein
MKRFIRFLLFILIVLFATPSFSQKAYKPIRSLLKEKKAKEALKEIQKLESDSVLREDPKLYDLGKQANLMIYENENEKLYLKKPYDTISFFHSIYGLTDYILRCDNKEKVLISKTNKKPKYQKSNRTLLYSIYKNLGAGGRFFFIKKNYSDAMKLMELYLELPKNEIWCNRDDLISNKLNVLSAYIYQKSAYLNGEFDKVKRYIDITKNDSVLRESVIELLINTAEKTKDTTEMLNYLYLGLEEYPTHTFYFSKLYEYFIQIDKDDSAYLLADSLSKLYPDTCLYSSSKVLPLINMCEYEEAIKIGEEVLNKDTTLTELHYYVGHSYCILADQIKLPTSINSNQYKVQSKKKKEYYKKALPHLEKYRTLHPDEPEKWGNFLHDIYWSLNMGTQYEEILKLIKK